MMKLLFCMGCGDVVRLFPERRSCKCGKSWGMYEADNATTVQSTNSVSLGIANPDFHQAVDAYMKDLGHFSPVLTMRCWINPVTEPDVRFAETPDQHKEAAPEDTSEAPSSN
jgi:hypothetical protein